MQFFYTDVLVHIFCYKSSKDPVLIWSSTKVKLSILFLPLCLASNGLIILKFLFALIVLPISVYHL